jgi:DNA-binding MarR family transcriptional regulator
MDEPIDEQNDELIELFFKLHLLLHRYHTFNLKRFGPLGNPHLGQGRVLSFLKHVHPHINQKELSHLLHMRTQSLGEILGKLERSGHIIRTPSETDRREMLISLTDVGAAMNASIKQREEELNSIFDCVTEEDKKYLQDLLKRIISSLEEKLKESPVEPECDAHHEHGSNPHGEHFVRVSHDGREPRHGYFPKTHCFHGHNRKKNES